MLDKSLPYADVIMVKHNAGTYPRFTLPNGYKIRCHIPGREIEWAHIMASVGETESIESGIKLFEKTFSDHPELIGSRNLFVVSKEGLAVATASLWEGKHFGVLLPRVHWVACHPDYQGLGLVKALLTALFEMQAKLSLGKVVYLTTQTWSYKAIGLYKKFGFEPYTGKKPANWECVGQLSDSFSSDASFCDMNAAAWQLIDAKIEKYKSSRS